MIGWVRAGGGCVRGNCPEYLKRGCNIKGRKETVFKKGGQAGSRVRCLKNGRGQEPPYELCSVRKWLNVVLPRNVKIGTGYTGKRLSFCFEIKNRQKFDH